MYDKGDRLVLTQVGNQRERNAETYGALHGYLVGGLTIPSGAEVQTVNWWDDYAFLGHEEDMPGSSLLPRTAINCVKQAESHSY